MSNILIIGASKGLGAALALGIPGEKDNVWLVSRAKPNFLDEKSLINYFWIEADLSLPKKAVDIIQRHIQDKPINLMIYNAGIWESTAFDQVKEKEICDIIDVNLTSLILVVRRFLLNFRSADKTNIVIIGSTSGLENEGSSNIAYVATKFGVRGVVHSLRELVRNDNIAVTCINPGSMATDVDHRRGPDAAIAKYNGKRIPVGDVINLVKCIRGMSAATCIKEVDMPAILDEDL